MHIFNSPHRHANLLSHQEKTSCVQSQLNEEELKNSKLLQQIAKFEEQITVISQESDQKDEVDHLLMFFIYSCMFLFDV